MPRNITVTFADGSNHVYQNAPDDISPDAVHQRAEQDFGKPVVSLDGGKGGAPPPAQEQPGMLASIGAGLGAGLGKVALGAQEMVGKGAQKIGELVAPDQSSASSPVNGKKDRGAIQAVGDWLVNDANQGRANLASQLAPYKAAHPWLAGGGELGGEVVGTLPVGGAIGQVISKAAPLAGSAAPFVNRLAAAATSSGVSTGAPVADTLLAKGADLGIRSVGAGLAGAATAAAADPDSAKAGAVVGALTPSFFKAAGITGNTLAGLIKPFFAAGQGDIAGKVLAQYATDPVAAVKALRQAGEIIPGSAPITAAAAGDVGLSGLTRTMQNASPDFASDLTARTSAQNAARTGAMEAIAGNSGKVSIAKDARDAATGAMRESVLSRAGDFDARPIVSSLDNMLANPNNAGQTAQSALARMRSQVASAANDDGTINARALYEIRKDAGLAMNGKLQGEASNLRYAKGQLDNVQGVFDNAIERAAQRPVQTSSGLQLANPSQGLAADAQAAQMRATDAAQQPATSWSAYLQKYADMSKPINQMDALQDVLKRTQTGSTDTQGNLILSGAKLNNILKNEGGDLAKRLTPEQMQTLHNLSADLNASQLGINAGKAVGSNTVQNLAGDNLLSSALGRLGASTPARTTIGNLLKVPYLRANQDIQNRIASALLNPGEAADLIEQASQKSNPLSFVPPDVAQAASRLAYRVPPLLTGTRR